MTDDCGGRSGSRRLRFKRGRDGPKGPVSLSKDDLPAKGLVVITEGYGRIHRIQMGCRKGQGEFGNALRPACEQASVEPYQVTDDGKEIVSKYRVVGIPRRLPFGSYGLCQHPECFRHVELVDG